MYMIDFSYADRRLSDFDCVVSYINTSIDSNISLGSDIKFETIENKNTHENRIIEADYNEPTPITFDICKNPCSNEVRKFSDTEVSYIMRWLNKRKYEKFCPIYDDGSYPEIYFKGSFNVSAIYASCGIVGFTLTFTPNAPYGFETEKTISYSLGANETFEFYNNSDEFGYLYPIRFKIICKDDGDFIMTNTLDFAHTVKIKNCLCDEIIEMDCQNKIILSYSNHLTLFNDFNYNFPRFVSNEYHNQNSFTVSMPCEITITYSLIRKAGIVV